MGIKRLLIVGVLSAFVLSVAACKEEPVVQKTEPAKIVYDPAKAQELASQRIVSVDVEASPIESGSDYIRLVAKQGESAALPDGFLRDVTSEDTKSVVLLAHIKNGEGMKLPPVPLFIFDKSSDAWASAFQTSGILSPFFVAQRAPLSVSLELILLKDQLDGLPKDAEELIKAYGSSLALYSKEGAHEISELADAFIQRIALVEETSFKHLTDFNVSYLESFGSTVNLVDTDQAVILETNLSVEGRKSILPLHHNRPPAYSELLSHQIGIHSPRSALADLEASYWSVPVDALHANCQALFGALKERLGLSDRDSALVLWQMIQPHALFSQSIDYREHCSGEDIAALLQEMGFALPPTQPQRPSSKTQNAMNSSLSAVARILKSTKGTPEKDLQKLLADTILVRDQARLLFTAETEQLISSATDIVAPTLDNVSAADFLMTLPLKSYGCYANGTGQVGYHRASLATLENDPTLWLLDFAFDSDNKINGIQLRNASQKDFCRAIGGRKGASRCVFSGKSFPGLSSDRCG